MLVDDLLKLVGEIGGDLSDSTVGKTDVDTVNFDECYGAILVLRYLRNKYLERIIDIQKLTG